MEISTVGVLLDFLICIVKDLINIVQTVRIDIKSQIGQRDQQSRSVLNGEMLGIDQIHDLLEKDLIELDVVRNATSLLLICTICSVVQSCSLGFRFDLFLTDWFALARRLSSQIR